MKPVYTTAIRAQQWLMAVVRHTKNTARWGCVWQANLECMLAGGLVYVLRAMAIMRRYLAWQTLARRREDFPSKTYSGKWLPYKGPFLAN